MSPLPHAVLIHGVNATSRSLQPLADALGRYATVHNESLPGHGGSALPDAMTIPGTGAALLHRLDQQGIERAYFVGYSLGGYTAAWLALNHPDRVIGVATIATRFIFTPDVTQHWLHLGHPDRMSRPGNPRAGQMLAMHGPDWAKVAMASLGMIEHIGRDQPVRPEQLETLTRPVLLVNGNRDAFLPWDHTLEMGKRIPNSKLVMFYGIAHPIAQVPAVPVAEAIGQWMQEVEP